MASVSSLLPNRQTCLVCSSCCPSRPATPRRTSTRTVAGRPAFIGDDYRWLRDDGVGGRNLDARTLFFYVATVNTPAMALHIPGVGSQYALTEHDSRGEYLDGGEALPAHRPARRPGQGLLVDRRLRPPDPIGAPDRPAVPEQEQHPRPAGRERRRLDHPHLRTDRTRRRTPATGSRPSPARSGSPSCGSTARSSPGSTRRGSLATSNRSTPTDTSTLANDGRPAPCSQGVAARTTLDGTKRADSLHRRKDDAVARTPDALAAGDEVASHPAAFGGGMPCGYSVRLSRLPTATGRPAPRTPVESR